MVRACCEKRGQHVYKKNHECKSLRKKQLGTTKEKMERHDTTGLEDAEAEEGGRCRQEQVEELDPSG